MDVLLSRLTWPSVLVRERAAVALAELMAEESPIAERAQTAILAWIGQQNLESTAALGVLVFCRLADQHPDRLPPSGVLDQSVRRPSLLSFALLQFLFPDNAMKPDWSKCHSGLAPSTFEVPGFFDKYRTNFLPSIYSRWMEEVQNGSLSPMFWQWAFEWAQLISEGRHKPSARVFDFGMRMPNSKIIVDFPLSEVYRSAYLRTLAWAVSNGRLSESAACYLALEACPVDLGLWRVKPGIKPTWWPTPEASVGNIDTVPARVWAALSSLWDQKDQVFEGKTLLAAGGRVFQGSTIYDLSIRAMFQVARGPVPGDPESIMGACNKAQGTPSGHSLYFGGTLDSINPAGISLATYDWSILPASVYIQPRIFSRWQYWRGYSGVQLPAPFLASDSISFRCEADSVKVFDGTTEVGSWRDWTDGVTEEFVNCPTYLHGWALEVSSELVDKFARESRANLGWICDLKVLHREHHYEQFREFSTYQLYGIINLVRPS
jgi:hypothetical protein